MTLPVQAASEAKNALLATAEGAGSKLFATYGQQACTDLAAPAMLDMADKLAKIQEDNAKRPGNLG
jgi:hypothetical protein